MSLVPWKLILCLFTPVNIADPFLHYILAILVSQPNKSQKKEFHLFSFSFSCFCIKVLAVFFLCDQINPIKELLYRTIKKRSPCSQFTLFIDHVWLLLVFNWQDKNSIHSVRLIIFILLFSYCHYVGWHLHHYWGWPAMPNHITHLPVLHNHSQC